MSCQLQIIAEKHDKQISGLLNKTSVLVVPDGQKIMADKSSLDKVLYTG